MYDNLTDEIELRNLEFSKRTSNALKRANIRTIDQLLEVSIEELSCIKNLGRKSLKEIKDKLKENKIDTLDTYSENYTDQRLINTNRSENTILNCLVGESDIIEEILFTRGIFLCQNLDIEHLQLCHIAEEKIKEMKVKDCVELLLYNNRSFKQLFLNNIIIMDEIINKLKSKMFIIYNNSIKTNEIYLEDVFFIIKNTLEDNKIIVSDNRLRISINNTLTEKFKKCKIIKTNENLIDIEEFNKEIFSEKYLVEILTKRTINFLFERNEWTNLNDITKLMPFLKNNKIIKENILQYLVEENKLEKKENHYRLYYPTVKEFINEIEDARNRSIIFNRLLGKTLEECGTLSLLTRERVRQIEGNFFKNIPRVREDFYKEVFMKYDWHQSLFTKTYNEDVIIFNYLTYKYKKGTSDIKNILKDEKISISKRISAERIIYKDYLFLGNLRVKRNRNSILEYILMKYGKNEIKVDEIKKIYYLFLKEQNLESDKEFKFPSRYFETTLANSKIVLWKYGKKLRYYNTKKINIEQLSNLLNLEEIDNLEISTLKLYREHQNIMNELDIRDEYELHNLIKKTVCITNKRIKAGRMPNLEFGQINRNNQVIEFLEENAPISKHELADKYDELYGVKSNTALSNYFECIERYLHDSYYKIDSENLPLHQFSIMKKVLKDKVYQLEHVRKIFIENFPEGDVNLISRYNLKQLGFKINSKIIFSDEYLNFEQYLKFVITKNDIFDSSIIGKWIKTNPSYYVALASLRTDFQVIEFSTNKYINISKLEENNVFKENLRNYSESIYLSESEEIFTLNSLRTQGFSHYLEELGFENTFYESILMVDERFSYRRVANKVLFRKNSKPVIIGDLIEYLVYKYIKIDVFDLMEILENRYGINLGKYVVINSSAEKELFYDPIMEKIYIDYDEYFEEV